MKIMTVNNLIKITFVSWLALNVSTPLQAIAKDMQGTIDVEGIGIVNSTADKASFSLAVTTTAENATQSMSENSKTMESIHKTLDQFDIEKKQRQTSRFNLDKQYDYRQNDDNGRPKFIGYTVIHEINIVDLKIDQLGKILDAVTQQGSTEISAIRFADSNAEQQIANARKLAVENAKNKAQQIADAADIELDGIVNISEQSYTHHVPEYRGAMVKAMSMDSDSVAVPIEQGEISHSVSVRASFAIEN